MSGMLEAMSENIKQIIQIWKTKIVSPVFSKLSTRLLFTLTMISAIPLIIVGIFMSGVTQESLSEYIQSQHHQIASRAVNEINLFLQTPITTLKILLETEDITSMRTFSQNLILNKVKSTYPTFNRLFVTDTIGFEITSTAFEERVHNYANEVFFKESIKGNNYFSEVYINERNEPYVISSHPIRKLYKIRGVLVGEIDLKSIWALVDTIQIGETGSAFVVAGNGQLIAHPDKRKILQQSEVIELDLILEVPEIDTVITKNYYSPEGIEMLGTFAYLPQLDWVLVIQQTVDEAFSVGSRMLYQVFGFVGLVILIAILLAYLLEKRITSPITTLVDGVKRYAEGDLDFRLKIKKYEEISVLADEFNSMAEKLLDNQRKLRRAERLAAMSKFAALVSHEIRNPLNSMNINMQILKREMENPQGDIEKMRKYYDIIISEIQRMDNLVKNFLMISRPPRYDFLPNDIHDILEEVILMHAGNAEQQNVQIKRQYCSEKILANVDRDQLKQVFHNIVINALQAMPNGGDLSIKTNLRRIKNRLKQNVTAVCIEFIDTGVGISKEKRSDIFEFYYTSKKTGTGLGLAIARQIVEGHNGIITVKSKEQLGTSLIVSIPLKSDYVGIKRKKVAKLG
jgi:nitrogen fixation/metabolism regulation signal transduction histidine kinase